MATPPGSFGAQLKARREMLDLTQQALGQRVGYSAVTIRKIELGERRPSKQLAELLALHLEFSTTERAVFVASARATIRADSSSPHAHATGTLPPHLSQLIGREAELDVALKLLARNDVRLITLTGPGGVGKTSLAREVAHAAAKVGDKSRSVVWVELAALSYAHQVLPAIARALEMVLDAQAPVLQRVIDFLSDKTMLLVLDNVEHVLAASKDIATLLGACPDLTVLATSRGPLHVPREQRLRVQPLPFDVARQLFIERAQEAWPELVLDTATESAIGSLCAHLDGLPLAIELVAARVMLMPPQAMLAHFVLDGAIALPLVADGTSDLPARHRTLQAAIQWSVDLLTDEARRAFRRLSVFVDSFTLDAAMHVACLSTPVDIPPDAEQQVDAWNILTTLLDASLITRCAPPQDAKPDIVPRFSLLETVRAAARLELVRAGEQEEAGERHTRYFARYAQECANDHERSHSVVALQRIRLEMADTLAATRYAIAHNLAERACRICAACASVWKDFAWHTEGLAITQEALALNGDDSDVYKQARAEALLTVVRLSADTTDHARTETLCNEAMTLFIATDDERGMWAALHQRAWQRRRINPAEGWGLHTELLQTVQRAGDAHWIATKLADMAVLSCFDQGDFAAAIRYADDAFNRFEALNNTEGMAYAISTKGGALCALGQLDEALTVLTRALSLSSGGSLGRSAYIEETLGAISLRGGDADAAVQHTSAAVRIAAQLGSPLAYFSSLVRQGMAEIAAGRPAEAEQHLRRALAYFDTSSGAELEDGYAIRCRIGLAHVTAHSGRVAEAAELLGAAQPIVNAYPTAFDEFDRKLIEEVRVRVRVQS